MKSLKKVLLIGAGTVLTLLILAVVLYPAVLAPTVNGYLHDLVQRTLSAQFQREVAVGDVRLTFPNPQITVSGLRIARTQALSEGTLLSVNSLKARIALKSLFARQIVIEEIALDAPDVWVEFDQQGRSNLPDFGGREPKPEPKQPSRLNMAEFLQRLTFPRIALNNATIHVVHQPSQLRVDVERLSAQVALDLGSLRVNGTIALEGGQFDWQERGPVATELSGDVQFAENTLTLSQVAVQANSTHVAVDGSINNALTQPTLNLALDAEVALEEIDRFLRLDKNLSGLVTVAGTVTGPPADIRAGARVTCANGTAWKLDFAGVDAAVAYQQQRLQIESLSADMLGGHVEGGGVLTFAPKFGYQADVTVTNLDIAEANRFTDRVELPISGAISGAVAVESKTVAFTDMVLTTDLTLDQVDAYGVRVPQAEMRLDIADRTLFIRDLAARAFQGRASGEMQMHLSSRPDYRADLDLRDVELSDVMALIPGEPAVAGRVSGSVAAAGATYALNDARLEANLEMRDLTAYGIASPRAQTRVRLQESDLVVEQLSSEMFNGQIEATGRLALARSARPKFALEASLKAIETSSILRQFAVESSDAPAIFDGRMSGEVAARGDNFALDSLSGEVNLTGEGAAVADDGAVPFAMLIESSLANQRLSLDALELRADALRVDASGAVDLAARALDLRYAAASPDMAALLEQVLMLRPDLRNTSPLAYLSGRLDTLRGTVHGPFAAPVVQAEMRATEADLVWAQADAVQASMRYDGESLQIENASLRYGDAAVAVTDGRILLADAAGISLNLPITLTAAPLQEYLALARQDFPLEGDVQATSATLRGLLSDLHAELDLTISTGRAWNQSFELLHAAIALQGDRVTLEDALLKKDGGRIEATGFFGFDGTFDAELRASDLDFQALDVPQDVAASYEGRADIEVQAGGTVSNPVGSAAIRLKDLVYRDAPIEDVTCEVTMRDQTVQATVTTFRQKLVTTVELDLANVDYRAELLMDDAAIEQLLAVATPIEGITGIISGAITSEGNLRDITATSASVKLDRLDLDIFGQQVSNVQAIDLMITPERFTVNSLDMRGDELGVFARGDLDFQGNFDLALDGVMDMRPFAGMLPPSAGISAMTGRIQVICNVRGTFLSPEIEGVLELRQGSLQLRAYPDPLKDIEGKVAFTPDAIQILGIQGKVGGGTFATHGTIGYAGTGLQAFQIDLSGEQIAVNQAVEDLTLTMSPHLQVSGTLAKPDVTGEVLIREALYTQDIDIQGIIANKSRQISLDSAEEPFPLSFDVFVRAPKDIQVRNRFAEIDLRADLRLQGTLAEPRLEGRVEILSGTVRFGDITYRIVSGVIDFSDPLRLNPDLNIQVETTVQEYTIALGVIGSLNEFTLDMQSEPELSQAQITRLLAGASNSGSGYDFVTKPLQTLVEGELGKAMRLDRFSVNVDPLLAGTSDTEAAPSVTLGKRLFGDLLLTFTTSLGDGAESSQVVTLEYQLSDQISFTASRNEQGEVDIGVTFKEALGDE